MHEMLHIRLLGSVGVEHNQQPVLAGKRKALALITYLKLTSPHRVTRGAIVGLLWPENTEGRARSSLRQCIAEIRRAIPTETGGFLQITPQEIALNADAVSTDIQWLESGSEPPKELLETASLAKSLFGGLWDINGEFDAWLRSERDRKITQLLSLLTEVMSDETGTDADRIRAAKLALGIDPLSEEASRVAMRLLASTGEIGAALGIYSNLYMSLDEQLGMEPSDITQDLAVAIKTGDVEPRKRNALIEIQTAALQPEPPVSDDPPRLAIFPFVNLGPSEVQSYFVDGILEDTVSLLAQIKELRVYSSNTTRRHRSIALSPQDQPTELPAEYFVTGTIRSLNGHYRVGVQLVDGSTGLVEWSQSYTASEADLFEMQTDIAMNIAHQLVPTVSAAELRRIEGTLPEDLGAYHLMLRAREIAFALDRNTFDEARLLLETARSKAPRYANSVLALADWHSIQLGQGWSKHPDIDGKALHENAKLAVHLSGENSRALTRFAHNRTSLYGFQEEAVETCKLALQGSPRDAETLLWSSPTLTFDGDTDAGIRNAKAAIELSPHDPYLFRFHHFLSIGHYAAGDFEAAANVGRSSYKANRYYTSNLRMTAAALVELGQLDEARHLAADVKRLDAGFKVSNFLAKQPFRDAGIGERYAERLIECGLPA